jgi:hypothetical protein
MSVDNTLDWMTKNFAGFFLSFIPYSVIINVINIASASINFLNLIFEQSKGTYNAIVNSFSPTCVFFYKYNSMYIPVVHRGSEIPPIYGEYEWIYYTDEHCFHSKNSVESDRLRRFDYLGGTLIQSTTDGSTYFDITEWLSEQRIQGPTNEVPLQVLVAAWAHTNETSVLHTFEGYKLVFMTLEDDSMIFCVQTGERLPNDTEDDAEEVEEAAEEAAEASTEPKQN